MVRQKKMPALTCLALASLLAAARLSAAAISGPEARPAGDLSAPVSRGGAVATVPAANASAARPAASLLASGLSVPGAPAVSAALPLAAAAPGLASAAQARTSPAFAAPAAPALDGQRRTEYQTLSAQLADPAGSMPQEQSKELADAFFESPRLLAAPSADIPTGPNEAAARTGLEPFRPQSGPAAVLKDRMFLARVWAEHLSWYTVTHIQDLWPAYQQKRRQLEAQGGRSAVSRPREFFSDMRVMGETGVFYVLGFAALNDQAVLAESRKAFARHFNGPGVGPAERQAFEAFLDRIHTYNAAHRAHSNMKKHIRDALLAASVMPPRQIAAFFDSLARQDNTAEIEAFQRQDAARLIETYGRVVRETLGEEPDVPGRVRGVVLMGSFARGAATPTSDLDTELLVPEGIEGRVAQFNQRLIAKWQALGLQERNPITPHEHPVLPSAGLLSRIHRDGKFLVFSVDPGLEQALSPRPGQARGLVRDLTWRGRLGRAFEFVTVYGVTVWTDLMRSVSGRS